MLTSLQAIANKARRNRTYRFRDLSRCLNEDFLLDSWKHLNRKAATGVDKITIQEYEKDLKFNIRSLVERLKRNAYRAKLVKRVFIPKGNGKQRPLGLLALVDKLLQTAVARLLSAIFEEDFLDCSFGYRPKRGAKDAVRKITTSLHFGRYTYVVDADIKGFFDNIDHEWLIKMLKQRIDDKRFIRLIRKWLKAGVLDPDGKIEHPLTGTPQGGIVSPVLANIYLHFALDLWFEKRVKPHCQGEAFLCRYADDFICAFRFARDADSFYRSLSERLKKFNLELAKDKTKIIKFSRFTKYKARFTFLGFEFFWGIDRKGKDCLKRRTARKKLKTSLANFKVWCVENRNRRLRRSFKELNSKLRGYYNYYGVIGNYESLREFYFNAMGMLYKWLNRRSQRRSFNLKVFKEILKHYGVFKPRITESRRYQYELFCT